MPRVRDATSGCPSGGGGDDDGGGHPAGSLPGCGAAPSPLHARPRASIACCDPMADAADAAGCKYGVAGGYAAGAIGSAIGVAAARTAGAAGYGTGAAGYPTGATGAYATGAVERGTGVAGGYAAGATTPPRIGAMEGGRTAGGRSSRSSGR